MCESGPCLDRPVNCCLSISRSLEHPVHLARQFFHVCRASTPYYPGRRGPFVCAASPSVNCHWHLPASSSINPSTRQLVLIAIGHVLTVPDILSGKLAIQDQSKSVQRERYMGHMTTAKISQPIRVQQPERVKLSKMREPCDSPSKMRGPCESPSKMREPCDSRSGLI